MAFQDSMDKIVTSYFSMVTKVPFTYKGKQYNPKALKVSPLILRGFTCPEGCGGCCPKFSLDYLPDEEFPYELEKKEVIINDKTYIICSDTQKDRDALKCKHLKKDTARCGIHGKQPFSCDFELIRFLNFEDPKTSNVLTQKLFGRGWQMMRTDGERGALCEMTEITNETIKETLRKINRLKQWCDYFEIDNVCSDITEWIVGIRPYIYKMKVKPVILNNKITLNFNKRERRQD